MAERLFRYAPQISETLVPWRDKLGDQFDLAIAHLTDRDRQLEDYLATRLPRGVLGHVAVTANQGSITTEVDLTGLSVTVTVGTSRRIKITGYTRGIESTVAADEISFRIKEGATQLEQSQVTVGSANRGYTQLVQVSLTPSAGSHTYKLTAVRSAGTGTLTMAASATAPAWILVEDIGPVS